MALISLNRKVEEADDDNGDEWYSDHELASQYLIILTISAPRHDGHMLYFLKHCKTYDAKCFWNIHFCKETRLGARGVVGVQATHGMTTRHNTKLCSFLYSACPTAESALPV